MPLHSDIRRLNRGVLLKALDCKQSVFGGELTELKSLER